MPSYSTSTPAATIRTNTTPSYSDYQFWIKPSTNEAFFSDGTAWIEIPTGAASNSLLSIENALNILEIQAADTITPDTSAQIAEDIFSDADGYNGTIDTGNTTALFVTDAYENTATTTETNPFNACNATEGLTAKSGMKVTTTSAISIISITKTATCTATTGYILDSSKSVLATASFSGNVATFATPYALSTATSYYFAYDSGGAAYTNHKNNSVSPAFPQATASFSWIGMLDNGGDGTSRNEAITSVNIGTAGQDTIIQTSMATLPSTPSNFIIFAFRDTLAGTGTIDADISFDNGANYQTGISLNTQTAIINLGDEMILKLNLNAGASAGTAEAKGYGVLFW